MMARLGHEDASSSSSTVSHAASDGGGISVTHGEEKRIGAVGSSTIAPSSTSNSSTGQEPPGKTFSTTPSQTKKDTVKMDPATTNASPSSLETEYRGRTSSMCSSRSGKESSSSGGEQLAQAVRSASLAFTSSSSSSSLCSSDGGTSSSKGVNKLETLKEEESAANTVGRVEESAAVAPAIALAPTPSSVTLLEPPASCKTGEESKESRVVASTGPKTNINSTSTVSRDNALLSNPMRPSASSLGGARITGVPSIRVDVPTVKSNKGSGGAPEKESRPQASSKKPAPRQNVIPSLKMLTRTAPPEVVTHGFVTSNPASLPTAPPPAPKTSTPLRRGKWTVEEEAYVARVIQDFNSGFLNAPAGTTLRSYLSEKLHCDPMRITKKFTGDACIGKRVFHPAVRCASNSAAIDKAQAELDALEQRWRRRLEMQQRESAKKAAASAAAAAAASGRSSSFHVSSTPAVSNTSVPGASNATGSGTAMKQTVVARTASWLDRATAVLSSTPGDNNSSGVVNPPVRTIPEDHQIEDQMNEVRRLIYEGPIIQQTTAGLPRLLHGGEGTNTVLQGGTESTAGYTLHDLQGIPKPLDKRPRRSSQGSTTTTTTTGAEDAEALVGFLNSVRAAASGDRSG